MQCRLRFWRLFIESSDVPKSSFPGKGEIPLTPSRRRFAGIPIRKGKDSSLLSKYSIYLHKKETMTVLGVAVIEVANAGLEQGQFHFPMPRIQCHDLVMGVVVISKLQVQLAFV